jgi:hypothetical protein
MSAAQEIPSSMLYNTFPLPNELIGLIFQEYIGMNLSVWDLTLVCKTWRRTAFATPSLWNHIELVIFHPSKMTEASFRSHYGNYYQGRRHVCFDHDCLRSVIARTGSIPLDVGIKYDINPQDSSISVSNDPSSSQIHALQLILKPFISKRFISLYLDISHDYPLQELSEYIHSASFRSLQELYIVGLPRDCHLEFMQVLSATNRTLESFHIFECMEVDAICDQVWQTVKYVYFVGVIPSKCLNAVFPNLYNAHEIIGHTTRFISSATPSFTFQDLQKLSMLCSPLHFRRIQYPSLQELSIFDPYYLMDDLEQDPESINLPHLVSFDLWTPRPHKWFSNVAMPRLVALKLHLMDYDYEPELFETMHLSEYPLKEVHLDVGPDDQKIIAILDGLPQVTMLTIKSNAWSMQFGSMLMLRLTKFDEAFACCSSLEQLTLGGIDCRFNQEWVDAHITLIKDMVSVRDKHNSPLRQLNIICRMGTHIDIDVEPEEGVCSVSCIT